MDREGYKQLLIGTGAGKADSDFRGTVDEMLAVGDRVAFRCTQRTSGMGKPITISEACFRRFEDGKVAEWWYLADMLGMHQQLGGLPPTGEIGR